MVYLDADNFLLLCEFDSPNLVDSMLPVDLQNLLSFRGKTHESEHFFRVHAEFNATDVSVWLDLFDLCWFGSVGFLSWTPTEIAKHKSEPINRISGVVLHAGQFQPS